MPSTRSYHSAVASISRQFNTIWSNRSTANPTFNPPDRCGAASSARPAGHRQHIARATYELTPAGASEEVTPALNLTKGSPVLALEPTSYPDADIPVEVVEFHYRPER